MVSTSMARSRPADSTAARGRCCGTSRHGTRQPRLKTMAGGAQQSDSTSTATTTVGYRTCWCPVRSAGTELHSPRIRDGQCFRFDQSRSLTNARIASSRDVEVDIEPPKSYDRIHNYRLKSIKESQAKRPWFMAGEFKPSFIPFATDQTMRQASCAAINAHAALSVSVS